MQFSGRVSKSVRHWIKDCARFRSVWTGDLSCRLWRAKIQKTPWTRGLSFSRASTLEFNLPDGFIVYKQNMHRGGVFYSTNWFLVEERSKSSANWLAFCFSHCNFLLFAFQLWDLGEWSEVLECVRTFIEILLRNSRNLTFSEGYWRNEISGVSLYLKSGNGTLICHLIPLEQLEGLSWIVQVNDSYVLFGCRYLWPAGFKLLCHFAPQGIWKRSSLQ